MKTKLMIAIGLLFTATAAFAQDTKGTPTGGHNQMANATPDEKAKAMTERMNTTVKLSAEQYTKVLVINKEFINARPTQASTTPKDEKAHAEWMEARNQRDQKLKAILTDEQWKQWEQNRAELGDRKMGRR